MTYARFVICQVQVENGSGLTDKSATSGLPSPPRLIDANQSERDETKAVQGPILYKFLLNWQLFNLCQIMML